MLCASMCFALPACLSEADRGMNRRRARRRERQLRPPLADARAYLFRAAVRRRRHWRFRSGLVGLAQTGRHRAETETRARERPRAVQIAPRHTVLHVMCGRAVAYMPHAQDCSVARLFFRSGGGEAIVCTGYKLYVCTLYSVLRTAFTALSWCKAKLQTDRQVHEPVRTPPAAACAGTRPWPACNQPLTVGVCTCGPTRRLGQRPAPKTRQTRQTARSTACAAQA